jgi:hypothetical protein
VSECQRSQAQIRRKVPMSLVEQSKGRADMSWFVELTDAYLCFKQARAYRRACRFLLWLRANRNPRLGPSQSPPAHSSEVPGPQTRIEAAPRGLRLSPPRLYHCRPFPLRTLRILHPETSGLFPTCFVTCQVTCLGLHSRVVNCSRTRAHISIAPSAHGWGRLMRTSHPPAIK